jgi:hypothetical protein
LRGGQLLAQVAVLVLVGRDHLGAVGRHVRVFRTQRVELRLQLLQLVALPRHPAQLVILRLQAVLRHRNPFLLREVARAEIVGGHRNLLAAFGVSGPVGFDPLSAKSHQPHNDRPPRRRHRARCAGGAGRRRCRQGPSPVSARR